MIYRVRNSITIREDVEKKILNFLGENPKDEFTTINISKETGINYAPCRSCLKRLREDNKVDYELKRLERPGKAYFYWHRRD